MLLWHGMLGSDEPNRRMVERRNVIVVTTTMFLGLGALDLLGRYNDSANEAAITREPDFFSRRRAAN